MSSHNTESITGLVDGELKGLHLWLTKRHVKSCPVCAEEFRRQQEVRQLLKNHPPTVAMSDSPEFFWSKVKAEIQRRGAEPVQTPAPTLSWADRLRQHQYALATATAME